MAVDLPALPRLATVKPSLISFGGVLTPPLGGPVQKVARLGSRYSVAITLPTLDAKCGAAWIAARLQSEAELDTLRLTWSQPDLGIAADLAVTGAGQAGARLAVSGPAGVIPAGAMFSFEANGRSYLHSVTTDYAGGTGQLTISPMLRASPPAGAVLHFLAPVIEGYADGTTVDWEQTLKRWTTLSFTLVENR